jgi:fermentation-respiration switch protein FrsA (DUF1100 family)
MVRSITSLSRHVQRSFDKMTATPASTTSTAWPTFAARLRSLADRASQVDAARLLHTAAVTIATAVAVFAMVDAASTLYTFAVRHESGRVGAIMLTAAVLGLYTVITAFAWRARLHGGRLPRLSWLLWWIAVGVGLAATAAAGGPDSWITRGISAVPMAALAALTALATRPRQP